MIFGKEFGVTIDEFHTYKDWGLILTDYTISVSYTHLTLPTIA